MAVLDFNDLKFFEEKDKVKVTFYRIYYFYLSKDDLKKIADFKVTDHSIEFDCSEKKATNKFYQLLDKGFHSLICSINKVKTVYIHKNSGIPLIGAGIFGIVDRNTNCIDIRPLTTCNLDCMYCSVDAGLSSKKQTDYVIEKDYLVEEINKLAETKKHDVEIHIGPQGEPLLYAPLVDLVNDLKKNSKIKIISMDTNATILTKKLVDELVEAGLDRFNISLNALDEKKCTKLAGTHYNLKHLLEIIDYASKKTNVLIAPVIIPELNDNEIKAFVDMGKKIKSDFPTLGIQNFLNYKHGRNPAKQRTWDEFFKILETHEKKSGLKLKLCKEDFGINHDTKLEKPFKKKQVVKARVVCDGLLKGEKIAVYKNRSILVDKAENVSNNSEIRVLIIRDKHNIFKGIRQ
ncbi:MAG: radical SAM protein [Nanoarchaeota archaeon]|nr:radical SAM protein [Nanoarchaeota archaeon]MBU1322412.1 radical SAM protein [Nanoarchaeota archaeon]MBU1598161.1 radical SAM protein [Nanoarchaeota archaeon]MBU2441432.1 radical SAM protein [Nanoarchaeota archaeon]